MTWKADHPPRHVHVRSDGVLVLKWDLEAGRVIDGHPSQRILRLIRDLQEEGRL